MKMRRILQGAAASICLAIATPVLAVPEITKPVPLAAHRAIYDLVLDDNAENKGVEALSGRLVYEETGNVCEGFTLRARQILQLQTDSGMQTLDSTTNSYESGDGRTIRFKIESRMNDNAEVTDGEAIVADGNELQIRITKPLPKRTSQKGEIVLPTALTVKILDAARMGVTTVNAVTYDGTGGGEATYDTFTLIGRRIEPGAGSNLEDAARMPELARLARWPVKISYFKRDGANGERIPEYSVFSEIYENGVSRAVRLNFSEFSVKATLAELKFLPAGECGKK